MTKLTLCHMTTPIPCLDNECRVTREAMYGTERRLVTGPEADC